MYSSVFVCLLLLAIAAATSVPVSQRARGAKIDNASGSLFSGGFQPSAPIPERRSDNYRADSYQASSATSYQAVPVTSYKQPVASSKTVAHASPRFFNLGSLFYGLQNNWPGVLIAVVAVIGAIIIVPLIISKLFGTGSSSYLDGYGRSEDGADSASLLSLLDEALQKYDVDATACMQRGVCSYVRKAALDVVEGRADSTDLIVDGLASNPLLTSWLDGTAILEASNAGRSGVDCVQSFATCSLSADSVVRAVSDLVGDSQ